MRFSKNRNGFTLIEAVLVIILVSIVMGITGSLMMQGAQSYIFQQARRELMCQAKIAMSRMDKEIRMIRSATSADIITFTATDLSFIDVNGQPIEFRASGANLLRNTKILAGKVSNLTFAYLKKDGTTASAATDIWSISVSVTVSGSEDITMRTRIFLRDIHGKYLSWKEV